MTSGNRRQLAILGILLGICALAAFAAYLLTPLEQLALPGQPVPAQLTAIPRWQLGAANAAIILFVYGALGLAGYWFARKLDLPALYREGAGWRAWLIRPMWLGLAVGVILVVADQLFGAAGSGPRFPHPVFPLSLLASLAAGIGEEILFRGFVMGLWAFLLNLALRRWTRRNTILWISNCIAALAFSAGHLPAVMILLNLSSPAQIPGLMLAELILLNSLLGLVAGERYMQDGLVAAMGVHFWADIVWHVLWPAISNGT